MTLNVGLNGKVLVQRFSAAEPVKLAVSISPWIVVPLFVLTGPVICDLVQVTVPSRGERDVAGVCRQDLGADGDGTPSPL